MSSLSQYSWIILFAICLSGANCTQAPQELVEEQAVKEDYPLNLTVLNYLKLKRFANQDFAHQTIGAWADFIDIDVRNKLVYFSIPKVDGAFERLEEICQDTSSIEFATREEGRQVLGKASLEDSSRMLLRFPAKQFAIDSSKRVSQQLGKYTYELGLEELRDLHKAQTLYNSPAIFVRTDRAGTRFSIANHMAPVAQPNEPSLQRLVAQILTDSISREREVQNLLDFVSKEIQYDFHGKYEIFMKPHETLLSGKSDCSGKVVLLASLLEQIGQEYLLVYMDGHIALGIPGDFPTSNEMYFEHNGKQYSIAETTLPGFEIGISRLNPAITEDMFRYLQYPGKQSKLYHILTGDSLDFLTFNKPIKG